MQADTAAIAEGSTSIAGEMDGLRLTSSDVGARMVEIERSVEAILSAMTALEKAGALTAQQIQALEAIVKFFTI